ncbi:type I glyceraldehyde-3-phosphate dehydrogenase [Congregibacter brevis]|uniref:Glyceraldehyde-3-phosphate dehydrogenase n=1 Tax=Congregibacter brevis TaxID=3081201 RepID=A0ABZ0I7D8_9GAMM|nr:type I glyceraldehyde-3-phosphate dehydrogenase [Congregibacter sp. IMCC45268]
MLRIAINGYGRIGRNILRALIERQDALADKIEVVAINDLGDSSINAHLTQYDSVHGRFPVPVNIDGDHLIVGKQRIRVLSERDPEQLPWKALNVDIVCECTGIFTSREKAGKHLSAGARKVLVSAPAADADATVVYGINDHLLTGEEKVVSNASCTTNCLAPMVKPLHESIGISKGYVTTIHSYTNDQQLSDVYHSDLYRARSATQSMIPTKTGAAAAIGLVLPELKGRLDGMAVRIPTINVSLVDLSFIAERDTSAEEVNALMTAAAEGPLSEVLEVNEAPLVSIDFNHSSASCVFDANHTKVNGNLVKVMAWYDNEWGFANRMLDSCSALFAQAELLKSA